MKKKKKNNLNIKNPLKNLHYVVLEYLLIHLQWHALLPAARCTTVLTVNVEPVLSEQKKPKSNTIKSKTFYP